MRAEKITDHQTKYDFISQILLEKWGTFDEIFFGDIFSSALFYVHCTGAGGDLLYDAA